MSRAWWGVKGTRYLLRAFATVARRHDDVQLVIIGDGPLKRSLQALAASTGLRERVEFLGARPHAEVLALMRKAAMLVLPGVRTASGREEGLGMVLLEAAATGLPVIASRVGGMPECVLDGRTGFLVPERDAAALAERMGELLGGYRQAASDGPGRPCARRASIRHSPTNRSSGESL